MAEMSEVERLQKRIADLEDAIEPLLPYAECDSYILQGQFLKNRGRERHDKFVRETIYQDMGIFIRLKHLMENRT